MKIKNIFAILLCFAILFGVLRFDGLIANAETSGCLTYTVSNGEVTITDCDASAVGIINIPSKIDGNSVTAIGDFAFADCKTVTFVNVPQDVKSIGNYAFRNCTSLTSVYIPDSVTSIGNGAFYSCEALYSVIIPQGVTLLGDSLFWKCKSLETVKIYGNITEIKKDAFYSCYNLKNLYISDASNWCRVSIDGDYYSSNPMYHAENVYVNNSLLTELHIPDDLQLIKEYQFYNVASIESVFIPKSVALIKQNAFYGCKGIKNIYYEGSETEWNSVVIQQNGNDYLKNATVSFNGSGAPDDITAITFVAVAALPEKTEYTEGEELDILGGKIAVGYPDCSYELFNITADMVTGFDKNKIGYQILTVTYKGNKAQFGVCVFAKADLNRDGIVGAEDIAILKKGLFSVEEYSKLADINDDGKLNIIDLIKVKKQIVG